jgi:hypothetical protein
MFKAAPLIYHQLLIIHAYIFGVMFPCCYAFVFFILKKDENIKNVKNTRKLIKSVIT